MTLKFIGNLHTWRLRVLAAVIGMLFLLATPASLLCAPSFPQASNTLLSQAAEMEKAKDHAGAERLYRQVLLTSPDDPEVLKALGVVCQEEGKYEESIKVFQQILKRAPLYPGVNSLLGVSYYNLNQYDRTIEADHTELRGNPRDMLARYYLALALTAKDRLFEALQQLESLAADDPKNLAVQYQLVVDYKAAMQKAGQRLATMGPDSEFTHAMKAEALADDNRLDDAILEFKEVLRKNSDFPGIHFAMGEVYWRKKDNQNALEQLKLALQEDPYQPVAHYYLADLLVDQQKFQDAIAHLKMTVAVYPHLARARYLLGKSYAGAGESQAALHEFDEALKLDPDYKEVHFQLYQLYARLGDKEKSQEHLRISERLTREGQDRDNARLQESLGKQRDSADKP